MINKNTEILLLKWAVALGCFVPLSAGLGGVITGTSLLEVAAPDISLQSHFRYLSGLLLGIGIVFALLIPHIERRTLEVRLLTFIVFIGGLARLYGVVADGWPDMPMRLALVMELVVTPALCLWQGRIAKRVSSSPMLCERSSASQP